MLRDYTRYLESIRDSLIQCGVTFSKIEDLEKEVYERVFYVGEELDTIMYFYNIMVCSGNMEEIFLPSNSSYKTYVRSEAFKEFSEDILPMLKTQVGDTSEDLDDVDCLDVDDVDDVDEPEEWVNNDVPVEDIVICAEDLFEEDSNELKTETLIDSAFSQSGGNIWETTSKDTQNISEISYVKSGRDLFDAGVSESKSFVSSGRELFKSNNGINMASECVEWSSVGVDLFSLNQSNGTITGAENVGEELLDEDEDFNSWISDSSEEGFIDEEDNLDSWNNEDLFDTESDADFDELKDEDEILDCDEDLSSWDEEDDVFEGDPEEPEDLSSWDEEENFAISDDESTDFSWEDEPDPEEFNSFDTSSISWEDDDESVLSDCNFRSATSQNKNQTMQVKLHNDMQQERDIVDSVQEAASSALTSAKQLIIRLVKSNE